jgi:hypothetical protein
MPGLCAFVANDHIRIYKRIYVYQVSVRNLSNCLWPFQQNSLRYNSRAMLSWGIIALVKHLDQDQLVQTVQSRVRLYAAARKMIPPHRPEPDRAPISPGLHVC